MDTVQELAELRKQFDNFGRLHLGSEPQAIVNAYMLIYEQIFKLSALYTGDFYQQWLGIYSHLRSYQPFSYLNGHKNDISKVERINILTNLSIRVDEAQNMVMLLTRLPK